MMASVLQNDGNVDVRGDALSETVIGAAIDVHRALGPGLLESAYGACLEYALRVRRVSFEREAAVPIRYHEVQLDCGYRADFLIERTLVVEIKAIKRLLPIHNAQVATYLKLLNADHGLLFNFNVQILRHGIRSITLASLPDLAGPPVLPSSC